MTPDIEYLLSLEAVRERSQKVFVAAKKDELSHFTYHASKLPEAAAYVTSVINVSLLLVFQLPFYFEHEHHISVNRNLTYTNPTFSNILPKRDFGPDNFDSIPPHGRWQHFNVGGVPRVDDLNKQWKHNGCNEKEQARRLIDLFMVSVLLDAGAGDKWKFEEPGSGDVYTRSEGIAVASLYMFTEGAFASARGEKHIVDGE